MKYLYFLIGLLLISSVVAKSELEAEKSEAESEQCDRNTWIGAISTGAEVRVSSFHNKDHHFGYRLNSDSAPVAAWCVY